LPERPLRTCSHDEMVIVVVIYGPGVVRFGDLPQASV